VDTLPGSRLELDEVTGAKAALSKAPGDICTIPKICAKMVAAMKKRQVLMKISPR
jgi:hypothetical protein